MNPLITTFPAPVRINPFKNTPFDFSPLYDKLPESRFSSEENQNLSREIEILKTREIEIEILKHNSLSLVSYVRYADHFVLLFTGTHQQVLEYKKKLSLFIENILNLTTIKAQITNTRKGYKFLGHVFIKGRGGVRQPVMRVDTAKVLKSLYIMGFCDSQGFPVEHTGYIAKTQGETNSIMNTILKEYKEFFFLAANRQRALNMVKYIIIYSIAKTYAAKFDLKTVRKVFSIAGKELNRPLKSDQRRTFKGHTYKAKILPPIRIKDYDKVK